MKKFLVKISDWVEVPYENGLEGNSINKNFIMYEAIERLKKENHSLTYRTGTPIFEYFIEENSKRTLL